MAVSFGRGHGHPEDGESVAPRLALRLGSPGGSSSRPCLHVADDALIA
ncbi:MAG: hypothetical protein JWP89_5381 [Schlesneria sp.]|nr:hypothetical protein [Schlesneria sp.]